MRDTGVVDHRHRRFSHACDVTDLAGVVHAHFDHRKAVFAPQLEQGQRHTDVVVKIAARRQHARRGIPVACAGVHRFAQYRGEHFLDGRLAVAACHSDQRNIELPAPVIAQAPERARRIVDDDLGQIDVARPLDEQTRGAGGRRLREKFMRVVAFALQRDEQVAGLDRAAVGAHRAERGVGARVLRA